MRKLILGLTALGFTVGAVAAPMDKVLDVSQSRVEVVFANGEVPPSAALRVLSGRVDYDEGNPAEAHLALAVAAANPGTVPDGKSDSFETADFPTTRFSSTSVVPGPAGQLDIIGTLTINDRSHKIRIPLFAGPAIGGQIFEGSFEISRSDFGIGEIRPSSLADDRLRVRFHLFQPSGA